MKKFPVLALVLGLWAAPHADAGVQFGRENDRARAEQVCVYKDINYFGAEQCYRVGEEIKTLGAQSNNISSIRVYGRAMVIVYEKTAFGGRNEQFSGDVADLGKRMMSGGAGWSDRINSLKIGATSPANDSATNNRANTDRSNSGTSRRSQSQQPRDGICVYDRPNYGGRSECWNQGQNIPDISGNWGGQVSSIRLFGGRTVAVVYQDIGYRGESLTVDGDIPDLAAIRNRGRGRGRGRGNGQESENWDRRISSVQIQAQRQGR
jgi:hypothetical protein